MQQCKLCLNYVARLEDSHYLSKGIMKRLRDPSQKNSNPWTITPEGAAQTSRQMKAHLLCRDCEQLLSRNGENWVLANCWQPNGTFPLKSLLEAHTPDIWDGVNPTRLYSASKIQGVEISDLAYFAASIFWRGSIHPWKTDRTVPVPLGPFAEEFRTYLLGGTPFPPNCVLFVLVRETSLIDRLTFAPAGERKGRHHVYRFPIPGLCFSIIVSKNIPQRIRELSFVHSPGNLIALSSILEPHLWEEGMRLVGRAIKLKALR